MRRHWGALLGILWLQVCWVRGMTVEQSPSALSLQEGASSTIKCNFSSTVYNVQWFRQHPRGGGLTRLFYITSGMQHSGRLNCTVNTKEQSSTLHIMASRLEDSATYLCAAQAQCSLVICSLHPNCTWACRPALPRGGHLLPCSLCTFSDLCNSVFSLLKLDLPMLSFHLLFLHFFFQKALCR
uniref:Ig-like domain-containing protein n=1 Tax=Mustela putorius furo TaxID=9669 RepID=M3Y7X2_MUSPF